MILAGYSKFQSKKGTNLCVMYFLVNVQEGKGAGYRPLKDAKALLRCGHLLILKLTIPSFLKM